VSSAELVAVIAAVGALMSSLAALVTALASYARLAAVHDAVNGQGAELRAISHSEGFAAGYQQRADLASPGPRDSVP